MIRYLFFAVVGTALFWGLYRLLLRREHCLNVNRFFLLATLGAVACSWAICSRGRCAAASGWR